MLASALERVRFQSTPPVWGATDAEKNLEGYVVISIHAPRVGGDI